MQAHHAKTDDQFAWEETRQRIRLEARIICNRMVDQILAEVNGEMLKALTEGRIIDLEIDNTELKRRLLAVAKKELGRGSPRPSDS